MSEAKLYLNGMPDTTPIFRTGIVGRFIMRKTDFMPLDQELGSIKEAGITVCVVYLGECWLANSFSKGDGNLIRVHCDKDDNHPVVQQVLLADMILS